MAYKRGGETTKTNLQRLNKHMRFSHPINDFLEQLGHQQLRYLCLELNITFGKKVNIPNLLEKICGRFKESPIREVCKLLDRQKIVDVLAEEQNREDFTEQFSTVFSGISLLEK